MRNILDRIVETITSHFLSNFFFSEKPAVYEVIWKTIVEPDMPQMTIYYGTCALQAG
jgi:hypothetical protein